MTTRITIEYIDRHDEPETHITDLPIPDLLDSIERAKPIPVHIQTGALRADKYINPIWVRTITVAELGD